VPMGAAMLKHRADRKAEDQPMKAVEGRRMGRMKDRFAG